MKSAWAAWGFFLGLIGGAVFADNAGENLLKNGDFSKGKMGWDMEPGVRVTQQVEGGVTNQLVEVDLHKSRTLSLSTRIQPKSRAKTLMMTARAKPSSDFASASPGGSQLTFRLERADKSTVSWNLKIKPIPEWQNFSLSCPGIQGGQPLKFFIMVHPGEGSVFLDDVVVKCE
jgi:hypothetical protein